MEANNVNTIPPLKNNFNYSLEALRGFVALYVVIYHVLGENKTFDPHYWNPALWAFAPPGRLAVLIFFTLSGYVIGISNKNPLNLDSILPYLKKRALRLYPIYFICITMAAIICKNTLSTIIENYTFTQILLGPPIAGNGPAWSLHYEVVFYLLFIPLSYFRMNPLVVLVICILLGSINSVLDPHLTRFLISSYFLGFAFWVLGLCLARYSKKKEFNLNYSLMLSNLFLLLSIEVYSAHVHLFNSITFKIFHRYLDILTSGPGRIRFCDLAYLPYCFLSVIVFSATTFTYKKQIVILLQTLPLFSVPFMFEWTHYNVLQVIVSTIYYILSWLLLLNQNKKIDSICKLIIRKGTWIGALSYGIYMIHFPILIVFGRIDFLARSFIEYIARVIIYIFVTIYAAYLLERKYAPFIKRYLIKDKKNIS